MMSQADSDSLCEMLYRLRDAINIQEIGDALIISREIHDLILELIFEANHSRVIGGKLSTKENTGE